MDKMQLAHDWAIELLRSSDSSDDIVSCAWRYADEMQAEANKRAEAELKVKRESVRSLLNNENTFIEREGEHFDDVADVCKTYTSSKDWQPDWSVAPEWALAWTIDKWAALWWSDIPGIERNMWFINSDIWQCADAPTFNYQGDWQDSLRKRP